MGVVYKAEHRVMGRMVALKILSPEVMANPNAIDRFRREVHIASRLTHPNIVTAYDADEAGGLHFLVMEFVDGESLDKLVAREGPLPVSLACGYIYQAAIGLQYAHAQGMIHRDIKPHNLMLTRSGQIKILDFGLARIAVGGGDPTSVTALELTQSRAVVGTPDFLSPEQARCVTPDPRSDLYSLGCTLYFLLVGRPPFGGVGPFAKMIAHVREPIPDVTEDRPGTPDELGRIIEKLMAKAPEDRYQTAAEVIEALRPFTPEAPQTKLPSMACPTSQLPMAVELTENETESPAPEPVKRSSRLLIALAIMIVLGLGVGAWAGHRLGSGHTPNSHSTAPPPPAQPESPPPLPIVMMSPEDFMLTRGERPPEAAPQRKKQILLVLPNEFAHGEYLTVIEELSHRHVDVVTAGAEKKPIEVYRYLGSGKGKVFVRNYEPDHAVKDITGSLLDAMDGVIVITGDPRTFAVGSSAGKDVKRIIENAVKRKLPVGATGAGVIVLGWCGFLEQREVSVVPGRPAAAAQLKVKKWVDDPKVVFDLPFITAGEYKHTKELVEAVVAAIPEQPRR